MYISQPTLRFLAFVAIFAGYLITPIWGFPLGWWHGWPWCDCNGDDHDHGHGHGHGGGGPGGGGNNGGGNGGSGNCSDTGGNSTDWRVRNFNTISSIYNLTVYPNQLAIFAAGGAAIPARLFNQNVTGRVDPVGTFSGYQDSIEYFFALSPVPQTNNVKAAITGYQITEFNSACSGVASSVVYLFCSVVDPGGPNDGMKLPTLKQVSSLGFFSLLFSQGVGNDARLCFLGPGIFHAPGSTRSPAKRPHQPRIYLAQASFHLSRTQPQANNFLNFPRSLSGASMMAARSSSTMRGFRT